jgi:hypothetical protein
MGIIKSDINYLSSLKVEPEAKAFTAEFFGDCDLGKQEHRKKE